MILKTPYSLTLLLALNWTLLNGQTLHAFIFSDNADQWMGRSCKIDAERMTQRLKEIERLDERLHLKTYYGQGDSLSFTDFKEKVKNAQVEPSDIMYFYFSGHGGVNYKNALQLQLNNGLTDISEIRKVLNTKNPRFKLIVTDCCNVFIPRTSTDRDIAELSIPPKNKKRDKEEESFTPSVPPPFYKKLFALDGHYEIHSSSPGQQSFSTPKDGSIFTKSFLAALNYCARYKRNINWEMVCEETQKNVDNTLMYTYRKCCQKIYSYSALAKP